MRPIKKILTDVKVFTLILVFIVIFLIESCEKNPTFCPDLVNGAVLEWTIDFEASWSPNGDSLVFVHVGRTSGTNNGIQLIDTVTHNKSVMFPSGVIAVYDPKWSPKGEWVVFNMLSQIYKIKTTGDSLTQLTFIGRNIRPNWSPDGNKIVYERTRPVEYPESLGVWIMDVYGNDKRRLFEGRCPSFSPDGSQILFVGSDYQIYISDTTGNNRTRLTSLTVSVGGRGLCYPYFSPMGDKIVFEYNLTNERSDVWVMNSDGTNLKRLTTDGGHAPAWSPDGSKIVYTNTCPENGYLWVMRPDGSRKRQISF